MVTQLRPLEPSFSVLSTNNQKKNSQLFGTANTEHRATFQLPKLNFNNKLVNSLWTRATLMKTFLTTAKTDPYCKIMKWRSPLHKSSSTYLARLVCRSFVCFSLCRSESHYFNNKIKCEWYARRLCVGKSGKTGKTNCRSHKNTIFTQYTIRVRRSLSPCTKCTFADFFVHFFFFSIYFIFMALSFVAHSTDTLYRFIYTTKHLDVCILFSFQRFINQSKLKANGLWGCKFIM